MPKGASMSRTKPAAAPMVARVYLRVSTDAQDLERQEGIITAAKAAGYYVAGIYREKASGARADRPELLRMVADLQPGEVVIAEKIDRISRLPLPEAERLVASIRAKGARLAVPGVVDLSDLAAEAQGVAKIVLESVQDMLLKLALQMARDDYEDRRERQRQGIELAKRDGRYKGRRADPKLRAQVIALRSIGQSIAETAKLAGCSVAQVKRIWASRDMSRAEAARHGAFVEDALTEADAGAAADVEQGAAELPEPAFLDDEGPSADLPAFIDTANIRSLYGWEPGETVEEAIARHRAKEGKTS
ncbi:resolvase (plasmid) [Serratia marcescens SM39]|uniref:Resolvase n=6 Tax=Pseudomonadota TaxID=1224 RepID=A7MAG5_PSEAI|nr:resolvase [Achromobacter ruhlandii]BAO36965.1 resolvase [Serratia marcescens SM39]CAO91761.1 resolvase [Pseudomonas aeruginosa]